MTAEEMRNEFNSLYNLMANSNKVENMHVFGDVQREMFLWFVANKPDKAQEFLDKLEAIKWNQYLTTREADEIVGSMEPKAPWSREQWKQAMLQNGFELEKEPCYNSCALFTTMNMIMSDSSDTVAKYIDNANVFKFVHDLAVDKLTDKDHKFLIREYFKP